MKKQSEMYAWWDEERKEFRHVYPQAICVEMCSPDGFKKSIEQGRGKILPVIVSEREHGG